MVLIVGVGSLSSLFVLEYSDSETLEKVWTVIPMIILVSIGIPRIRLLCYLDFNSLEPQTTTKVMSNQWNWQRESHDTRTDHLLEFESLDNVGSYESPMAFLGSVWRLVVVRTDVLHSLGIPGLAIKLDSIPGRLNSLIMETHDTGIFPGACYELCGRGHSVMPIRVLVL